MPGELLALRGIRAFLDAPGFLMLVAVLVSGWLVLVRLLLEATSRSLRGVAVALTFLLVWISLAGIAELTLFGTQGLGADPRVELDPIAGARGWAGIAWRPVIDNVALFVPLGAGLAVLLRRWSLPVTLLVGAAVSLAVETFQWAVPSGRIANSADVVANVVGVLLGAVLAVLVGTRRAARAVLVRAD
jgi:hypothetical protein